MANLLGSFLAAGGNLPPDDRNPDVVRRRLDRWRERGRDIPYGMDEAQFREYIRRLGERPGQQNAILAEMGLADAGGLPLPRRPTTRGVTTLPLGSDGIAVPPPTTFEWEQAMGGNNPNLTPPPTTQLPPAGITTANNPFTVPPPPPTTEPPPTTSDATRYVPPFPEGTVNREPNPLWADIGRGLRNFGNSETGPDGRVNPISQGLLAGLGPPLPPPQTGWISNPLGQRPPPYGQRQPSARPGFAGRTMFG